MRMPSCWTPPASRSSVSTLATRPAPLMTRSARIACSLPWQRPDTFWRGTREAAIRQGGARLFSRGERVGLRVAAAAAAGEETDAFRRLEREARAPAGHHIDDELRVLPIGELVQV